ncbi:MAG: ABC transporter, partial [Actinobacteria bacterium]
MARPATRNIGRLSEIAQVAVKHGFGYFFERHRLTDLFPWISRDGSADTPSDRGRRLREMLDELGPTFVKFGQLLSTRPDIVPPDIVVELQKLQDDVRPIPFADVRRVIEEELGLTIEQAFLEFDEQPTAAASIGQVHHALLPNGERVAVKVQRPNAPRQIESDIALLFQAARLAKERVRALDFIDAEQVVDEFARSIRSELDYRAEARNAEIFRRNFAGQPDVKIPRVYWTYTRRRVLVLELLEGVQLADLNVAALSQAERRDLAYRIAETWMTMIFRHGFFHGDPHPANIFVMEGGAAVGLVDFGQVGKLTDEDMSRLTGLFIDAANERIDALPRRLAELGVRFPRDREEEFGEELRDVYYRYYGVSLAEIDPMQVIREAFEVIYRMNLRLPTRFVLLDKAIATLASVGIELYPEFNVFEVAKPYARNLMIERFSPERMLARAQKESHELVRIAA